MFTATIVGGELRANEGEIAELGWFDPDASPHPTTDVGPHAVADWVRGERGVRRRVVTAA